MTGKNKTLKGVAQPYREEPVKPAVYTALIVVAIVAAPLGWLNQKIGAEGFKVADTSQYQNLVLTVNRDVRTVRRMLDNEAVDEKTLKGASLVTLITPDIAPTNASEATVQETEGLKIKLSGIYWSPTDPIATINGENYHIGESVLGHRIIGIRKTEVVFEDPMGEKVVKRFYDYLD